MSRTTERTFYVLSLLILIGCAYWGRAAQTQVPTTRVELARATPAAPPCPCAELLQPVHITARRYRHPHDPVPLIMECQAPEVAAPLPRTIDWPEPPLRSFTPTADAHFDFSEPPDYVPNPYFPPPEPHRRTVSVPEPSTWALMLVGLAAVFGSLLPRRQR